MPEVVRVEEAQRRLQSVPPGVLVPVQLIFRELRLKFYSTKVELYTEEVGGVGGAPSVGLLVVLEARAQQVAAAAAVRVSVPAVKAPQAFLARPQPQVYRDKVVITVIFRVVFMEGVAALGGRSQAPDKRVRKEIQHFLDMELALEEQAVRVRLLLQS